MKKTKKRISASFQKWLLVIVAIAFVITLVFLWRYQTKLFTDSAENLLDTYIKDVKQDIADTSDKNLLVVTHAVATELNGTQGITNELLAEMLSKYNVSEINYVDTSGIIVASSNESFVGFNMATNGYQPAEFMALLGALTEYVQDYSPSLTIAIPIESMPALALPTAALSKSDTMRMPTTRRWEPP